MSETAGTYIWTIRTLVLAGTLPEWFCRNGEICRRILPLDGRLLLSERAPSLATAPLSLGYGASLVDACYMAACTYEAK